MHVVLTIIQKLAEHKYFKYHWVFPHFNFVGCIQKALYLPSVGDEQPKKVEARFKATTSQETEQKTNRRKTKKHCKPSVH